MRSDPDPPLSSPLGPRTSGTISLSEATSPSASASEPASSRLRNGDPASALTLATSQPHSGTNPPHASLESEIDAVYSDMTISIGVVQGDLLEITEEITDEEEQEEVLANAYEELKTARASYTRLRALLRTSPIAVRRAWAHRVRESQTKLQRAIDDLRELQHLAMSSFDGKQAILHLGTEPPPYHYDSAGPPPHYSSDPTDDPHSPASSSRSSPRGREDVHDGGESASPQSPLGNYLDADSYVVALSSAHSQIQTIFVEISEQRQVIQNAEGAAQQQSAVLDLLDSVQYARTLHNKIIMSFRVLPRSMRREWKDRVVSDRDALEKVLRELNSLEESERGDANVVRPFASNKSVRFTGLEETRRQLFAGSENRNHADVGFGYNDSQDTFRLLLADLEDALEDMDDCEEDEREAWLQEIDNGIQKAWTLHMMSTDFSNDDQSVGHHSITPDSQDEDVRLRRITEVFEQIRSGALTAVESQMEQNREEVSTLYKHISGELLSLGHAISFARQLETRELRQEALHSVEAQISGIKSLYEKLAEQVKGLDHASRAAYTVKLRQDRNTISALHADLQVARTHVSQCDDVTNDEELPSLRDPLSMQSMAQVPQVTQLYHELIWMFESIQVDISTLGAIARSGLTQEQLEIVDGRVDQALEMYSNLKSEVRGLPEEVKAEWVPVMVEVRGTLAELTKAYVTLKLQSGIVRRRSNRDRTTTAAIQTDDTRGTEIPAAKLVLDEARGDAVDYDLELMEKDVAVLTRALRKDMHSCRAANDVDIVLGIYDDLMERLKRTKDLFDSFTSKVRALSGQDYVKWAERAKIIQIELKNVMRQLSPIRDEVVSKERFAKYSEPSLRIQECDHDLAVVIENQLAEIAILTEVTNDRRRADEAAELAHKVGRATLLLNRCVDILRGMSQFDRDRWKARITYQQRRVEFLHRRSADRLGVEVGAFVKKDLSRLLGSDTNGKRESLRFSGLFRMPRRRSK